MNRFRSRVNAAYYLSVVLIIGATLGAAAEIACAGNPPPTLSPVGVRAFYATRAVGVLDVVRDTAVAAEAATPKLLSTTSARAVVEWHRAAVAAAGATPNGWEATALVGLDGVEKNLDPAERKVLAPYFALARAVLSEVK